ncbi:copper resistance protein CopC/CopD [Agrobacterium tumefaciens]|uniref:copper resistance CopC/CopD family protein n=1 Tax=Agrobacterium tumefaciens TaxID=358 RepID=UPI0015722C4A|nr:copper resistance protein CopC [Agrobacterium tumefaciens]NTA84517.1 copper resistance protein CopC/CopD [Agrobacterium tumefaciens]
MVRRQEVSCLAFACERVSLALIAVILVFFPTVVAAHAVLISSTPAQGERLPKSPQSLSLRFSEEVTRVDVSLVNSQGERQKLDTVASGGDVRVELPGSLADGAYAFTWRIVSEDGHPVSASVVFSIGEGSNSTGFNAAITTAGWIIAATWTMKFVFYCATLFGIGGVFFSIVIARERTRLTTTSLLALSGLCALTLLVLFCLEEAGGDITTMATPEALAVVLDCSLVKSVALILVSLCLAFGAGRLLTGGAVLSTTALAILGPAFALTGHASGAGISWLSFSAVSLHVIAVAFWAGSLPGLWKTLGREKLSQRETLMRFSFVVPFSIGTLLLAGTYLAVVQVGTPLALLTTDYGLVLLAKLALVAIALALGTWNRLVLTQPVSRGSASAAATMKAIVALEIALLILVLAVTALWRFTPPPRALALRAPIVKSVHIHTPAVMAKMRFDTTADLRFDVEVSLTNGQSKAIEPGEVTLRMSSPASAIAPFEVRLHRRSPGIWSAEKVRAPCDCDWNVRLGILVSDFEMVDLDGKVKLLAGKRVVR